MVFFIVLKFGEFCLEDGIVYFVELFGDFICVDSFYQVMYGIEGMFGVVVSEVFIV